MRSTTLGVVVLVTSFVLSACGGGGGRSLDNPKQDVGIENPSLNGDKFALKFFLTATVSDAGAISYSLVGSLLDQVPNSDLLWSNLLGDRFLVKIGANPPLQMQYVGASGDNAPQFVLEDTGPLSAATFLGLHNASVTLTNLGGEPLGQSFSTPLALASYPVNFPPYSQRILSNCAPQTNEPDVLTWQNISAIPFKVFFFKPDGSSAIDFINLSDSSSWQLTPNVFQAYFSSSEINELETPQAGVGYGVDMRPGRVILVRGAQVANIDTATNPQRVLPVIIQTREEANYQIEYQGGCNP